MKTTIIYAHPYIRSFNHAILNKVTEALINNKEDYEVIDLYNDKFDPTYSTEELSLFSVGKTIDPLVSKYQKIIKSTDEVIFIFPVWWNDTPAIIKGFIDKIMKKDFAYNVGSTGVIGNLKNIKKTLILTTSTSPTFYLKMFCGNAIKGVFINSTLKQLNFQKRVWKNFGSIDHSSISRRNKYLEKIANYVIEWVGEN